ncbi:hypothetical protein M440DRAFT_1322666 [Trichoderma longibrachiatum ATCC 18648]|uniref:RING-type E3 ubiquitin transferase n=1 Tax=Trichoderma longibrachiatum ATCC 18648 TaxID=983965 RepID=A0A2T4CIV6_TRILO|nr:hypothetical protein M440DRAFT_1322666 [Trichoderma longibrachiatum ATCC 18648]
MASSSTPPQPSSPSSSPYPFAAAPDIVRSHQKDAYFTGNLANSLTDLHRRLFGARSAHALAPELRTAASLLYFGLTTLPGHRTLGEEYCDLVQAVVLALFYFNGTYYELTKRLLSLRYVFTRTVPDTPDRAGYELLGVLLVIQMAVQAFLHVRDTFSSVSASASSQRERLGFHAGELDVSLSHNNNYSASNNDLLLSGVGTVGPQATKVDIATTTHTPVSGVPRFHLENESTMGYIKGSQQRKCTLCLEEMKDPAATQCGHVFCWECIGDWVREKPECPLCRREAMVQHILPLRVM